MVEGELDDLIKETNWIQVREVTSTGVWQGQIRRCEYYDVCSLVICAIALFDCQNKK